MKLSFLITVVILHFYSCSTSQNEIRYKTHVSIKNGKWNLNEIPVNQGASAEGLLMNVRMVNAPFEDRGPTLKENKFDPESNTFAFVNRIPEYVHSGVNAFTISLQGGLPGYEGAVNTAFNTDGSLRESYMQRIENIITASDRHQAVVILSLFYQRQHSHQYALSGKTAIMNAVKTIADWIRVKGFTNVVLEISNEYRHGGFKNWNDGTWLMSEQGQVELINLARKHNPALLVSTSGMGNGLYDEVLAKNADFILIHFNNTPTDNYAEKIKQLKKYNKPIVCNEDNKVGQEGALALAQSVLNGAGWGYMNAKVNQDYPFRFNGTDDDTAVYNLFKKAATPGTKMNISSIAHNTITIEYPTDGTIIGAGELITIQLSHQIPSDSLASYKIEIYVDKESYGIVGDLQNISWKPIKPGTYYLEALVSNKYGTELFRSPPVDVIVQ